MYSRRILTLVFLNVAGLFLLAVAALFHQEPLYLMAGTLFLIPGVSFLVGRLLSGGLACERAAPTPCGEGEPVTVTLSLTAVGPLPKFFLRARDRLPRWLRSEGDPPLILQLWPGETQSVSYTLEPEKRGVYTLGPARVTTTDPLGFFSYTRALPGSAELLVYPRVLPLRQLPALDGAAAWGRESRDEGPTRGDGLDFHGVREYRYGDELRRVHWRTTARTGRLAVMEYTQGATGDVSLALDLGRDAYAGLAEGPDSALEYALRIAATVAAHLIGRGCGVRLLSQATLESPMVLRDGAALPRLLEALARAEADSPLSLAAVLGADRARGGRGETLVLITPDPGALGDVGRGGPGARSFAYVLDRASFGAPGPAGPGPDAPFQWVRRGDDLTQTIEGWLYARR